MRVKTRRVYPYSIAEFQIRRYPVHHQGIIMKTIRTSRSSPLKIAEVPVAPSSGRLGLTICPGKKHISSNWDRDLPTDLKAIQDWGATTVVTLIEDHEFRLLSVQALEREVRELGMDWLHLPILDVSVPDSHFEQLWGTVGETVHSRLDAGERILIHCRGGLGRTGEVAGLILVERGIRPQDAIRQIRAVRPHAIETSEQEDYVMNSSRSR